MNSQNKCHVIFTSTLRWPINEEGKGGRVLVKNYMMYGDFNFYLKLWEFSYILPFKFTRLCGSNIKIP